MSLPEQLFLDLRVRDVLDKGHWLQQSLVEPWATAYVDAINDGRFGDAIWARYHMLGGVENGLVDNRLAVMKSIEEDAIGYRRSDADIYAEALVFYGNRSSADGHADVIDMLFRIGREDHGPPRDE